uniref:EF-hand domain-containing protein n=1 Tax=Haptolina ericina TaxID=156174 RepID=A0A7S3C0D1_9EUKA
MQAYGQAIGDRQMASRSDIFLQAFEGVDASGDHAVTIDEFVSFVGRNGKTNLKPAGLKRAADVRRAAMRLVHQPARSFVEANYAQAPHERLASNQELGLCQGHRPEAGRQIPHQFARQPSQPRALAAAAVAPAPTSGSAPRGDAPRRSHTMKGVGAAHSLSADAAASKGAAPLTTVGVDDVRKRPWQVGCQARCPARADGDTTPQEPPGPKADSPNRRISAVPVASGKASNFLADKLVDKFGKDNKKFDRAMRFISAF